MAFFKKLKEAALKYYGFKTFYKPLETDYRFELTSSAENFYEHKDEEDENVDEVDYDYDEDDEIIETERDPRLILLEREFRESAINYGISIINLIKHRETKMNYRSSIGAPPPPDIVQSNFSDAIHSRNEQEFQLINSAIKYAKYFEKPKKYTEYMFNIDERMFPGRELISIIDGKKINIRFPNSVVAGQKIKVAIPTNYNIENGISYFMAEPLQNIQGGKTKKSKRKNQKQKSSKKKNRSIRNK